MKTYTFEVVLSEGSDEFWESLHDKTGCDEVLACVREALEEWDVDVRLVKYQDPS